MLYIGNVLYYILKGGFTGLNVNDWQLCSLKSDFDLKNVEKYFIMIVPKSIILIKIS